MDKWTALYEELRIEPKKVLNEHTLCGILRWQHGVIENLTQSALQQGKKISQLQARIDALEKVGRKPEKTSEEQT